MPGVVPDEAEVNILSAISPGSLRVRLFKNDHIPGPGTTLASLVEADFPGYAEVDITAGMSPIEIDTQGKASTTTSNVVFEWDKTGPAPTVYGYYVVDTVKGFMGIERFSQPRTLTLVKFIIWLTVTLTVARD